MSFFVDKSSRIAGESVRSALELLDRLAASRSDGRAGSSLRGIAITKLTRRLRGGACDAVQAAQSQRDNKHSSNVVVAVSQRGARLWAEVRERSSGAVRGGGLKISAAATGKDVAACVKDRQPTSQSFAAMNIHARAAIDHFAGHDISVVDESLVVGPFDAVPFNALPLNAKPGRHAALSIAETEVVLPPMEWEVVVVENKLAAPVERGVLDVGIACLPIFYEMGAAADLVSTGMEKELPQPAFAVLIDMGVDEDDYLPVFMSGEADCKLPVAEEATVAVSVADTAGPLALAADALRKINDEKSVGLAVDAVAECLGPEMTMDVVFALGMVRGAQEVADMRCVLERMDAAQQARMLKGFVGFRSGRGFRDL